MYIDEELVHFSVVNPPDRHVVNLFELPRLPKRALHLHLEQLQVSIPASFGETQHSVVN